MGFAIAEAALLRGARVTLIKGTTSVPPPDGAEVVEAETAAEMREAVLRALPGSDALVMAAAVADFRPSAGLRRQARSRRRAPPRAGAHRGHPRRGRRPGPSTRPGPPTATAHGPLIVGFAAETGSLDRAPEKAARKGVDLLVANDVAEPGSGFGTDTNRVTIHRARASAGAAGRSATKAQVAHDLLDRLVAIAAACRRAVHH